MYFRKSLFKIEGGDFALIVNAMGIGHEFSSQPQGVSMSGTLVLVRHGQSEWNLKNLFTGWRDVDLTELGREEARSAGEKLKERGLKFDVAFTSVLMRAQKSNDIMLDELGQTGLETIATRR